MTESKPELLHNSTHETFGYFHSDFVHNPEKIGILLTANNIIKWKAVVVKFRCIKDTVSLILVYIIFYIPRMTVYALTNSDMWTVSLLPIFQAEGNALLRTNKKKQNTFMLPEDIFIKESVKINSAQSFISLPSAVLYEVWEREHADDGQGLQCV